MPLIARRRCRAVICALVVLARPDGAVVAAPCWPPPVVAPVTDPFREPDCRWCPGNRGIEYGTAAGVVIRAIAAGTVTFAGASPDTTYVVVRHADGLRLTYGNLEPVEVAQGDVVARGTRLGVTAGRFHLGLRDGERYVDPAPFLGVERRVVRLVPVDGSAANPSPLPRLVCGAGPSP
jgi:murein DD-endopeptidase MepM/ murein hydrolase activator NlpD